VKPGGSNRIWIGWIMDGIGGLDKNWMDGWMDRMNHVNEHDEY
jgi:hypothetical protein